MKKPLNKPRVQYLTNKLNEECGELIQANAKTHAHGLIAGANGIIYDNRSDMEDEAGDVIAAIKHMAEEGVIDMKKVLARARFKLPVLRKLYDEEFDEGAE